MGQGGQRVGKEGDATFPRWVSVSSPVKREEGPGLFSSRLLRVRKEALGEAAEQSFLCERAR